MKWLVLMLQEMEEARKKVRLKGNKKVRRKKGEHGVVCRWCGSREVVKNGKKPDGRQTYLCKECGRRMVEKPKYKRMREEDLKLALKMRAEGMSYGAIGRVLGYSEAAIRMNISKKTLKTPSGT